MHARSGGVLEVMGLMTGKIEERTLIVMDSFALPVEGLYSIMSFSALLVVLNRTHKGTETRVNAQVEAYEYMVSYLETIKKVRW